MKQHCQLSYWINGKKELAYKEGRSGLAIQFEEKEHDEHYEPQRAQRYVRRGS